MTAKLVAELASVDIDGGGNAVCKAIEDLIKDSEANTIYRLRRDGHITQKIAANELGLSVDEYIKREDKYFCNLEGKKEASASS